MDIVRWTLYVGHGTLDIVHWTVYVGQRTVDIVRWTSFSGHHRVDMVRGTSYVGHLKLDIVRWTSYVGHCTLDIVCFMARAFEGSELAGHKWERFLEHNSSLRLLVQGWSAALRIKRVAARSAQVQQKCGARTGQRLLREVEV